MFKQLDVGQHGLGLAPDMVVGAFKLLLDGCSLDLQRVQSHAEFARRQGRIGGKVEQTLLLDVELGQFGLEANVCLAFEFQPALEVPSDLLAHGTCPVGSESKRRHVAQEGILNVCDAQVRKSAVRLLASRAEVVLVGLTSVVDGLGVDQLAPSPSGRREA